MSDGLAVLNALELFSPLKKWTIPIYFRLIFIFDRKEPQSCQIFTYSWKALLEFFDVTNRFNDLIFNVIIR